VEKLRETLVLILPRYILSQKTIDDDVLVVVVVVVVERVVVDEDEYEIQRRWCGRDGAYGDGQRALIP
jgi:hypothetical protein